MKEKMKPVAKFVQIAAGVILLAYVLFCFIGGIVNLVKYGLDALVVRNILSTLLLVPIAITVILKKNHVVSAALFGVLALISVTWVLGDVWEIIRNIRYISFMGFLSSAIGLLADGLQFLALAAMAALAFMYWKQPEHKLVKFWFAPAVLHLIGLVLSIVTVIIVTVSYGYFVFSMGSLIWNWFKIIVFAVALGLIGLATYLNSPENLVWDFVSKQLKGKKTQA